jgi:hypothetical protein
VEAEERQGGLPRFTVREIVSKVLMDLRIAIRKNVSNPQMRS